jgi:hypothetical protein
MEKKIPLTLGEVYDFLVDLGWPYEPKFELKAFLAFLLHQGWLIRSEDGKAWCMFQIVGDNAHIFYFAGNNPRMWLRWFINRYKVKKVTWRNLTGKRYVYYPKNSRSTYSASYALHPKIESATRSHVG